MKLFTSALVLAALFGSEDVSAIKIKSQATGADDLIKELAEDMQKDADAPAEPAAEAPKKEAPKKLAQAAPAPAKNASALAEPAPKKNATAPAKAAAKKPVSAAKKEVKTEEEEIPMDTAAIKAYSSVIADAAEDSEPQQPVVYTEQKLEEDEKPHREAVGVDAMGSMIQNEITSIKKASIKAAADRDD